MTGAVKEADRSVWRAFGFETTRSEQFDDLLVNVASIYARANRLHCRQLPGAHRVDQRTLLIACSTAKKRARHVAVETGAGHARENVDDDEFVRAERARAPLMGIAG